MSVDVDVAEGGTATSQKRYDPLDDWSTTNSADRPPTPPRLTPSEVDRLWEDVAEQRIDRYSPPTPESHGSTESVDSNWPNYAPSNPGSPRGSHPGRTGGSPLPLPHPGPSEDRLPSTPDWPVNSGSLSSTGHQPTPLQSPAGGSPLPPLPHLGPSEDRLPSTPGWSVNFGTLSSTSHQPTPPQNPAGGSPLPLPGPSEDRFPSANPDTLSPTGNQPIPPQSPSRDPATRPPPSPEPLPDDGFLDKLLKGKIKRRISGSVNSAQRDPRSTNIPT
jgi:hypothetical protein